MILDKVFHGVLDQGLRCLIVLDEPEADMHLLLHLSTHLLLIFVAEYVWRSYWDSGAG
jgi:hypothetical protein